jgi:hypothetical protein
MLIKSTCTESFSSSKNVPHMTTLDITNTSTGIILLQGFGEKHWETGIYLNGNLFEGGRDDFEEDEPSTKLCRFLAKEAGYSWEEHTTHIWWRLSSYSDIPGTLAEYDEQTVQAYRNASVDDYAAGLEQLFIPDKRDEEYRMMYRAFALSGGDDVQFDTWYDGWLQTHRSFNDRHRADMDRYLALGARVRNDESSMRDALEQQRNVLRGHLKQYLVDAYRADKPLDPVAKRARAAA